MNSKLSKEADFFAYLLVMYADYKKQNVIDVYKELSAKNILTFIKNSYEQYHQETLRNAFNEIDNMLAKEFSGDKIPPENLLKLTQK